MSKPLSTKVSTPLSENVQIRPKVSIFSIFPSTALTLLGMEFTRASQVATGVLFHSSMMTSRSWWMLMMLLYLLFGDAPQIIFTLSFFNKASAKWLNVRQWSSWRCVWGRYHVEILPCGPVSKGRGSCSASVHHSTCRKSWFPQWTVAPQCRQHSWSPRPWHSHHHAWLCYTHVFVLLTWLPPHTLDTIWTWISLSWSHQTTGHGSSNPCP